MLKTVRVPEKFAPLFERAQQYVTRYFADQKSAPERGTLEICGQRYVLVRAASMSVEFYEMVTKLYGEEEEALAVGRSLLFDIAHAMGLADAKSFAEHMDVNDPIARLSAGPVHFAHAGWAFVDILPESNPSPDEEYYLLFDHPYSFESDAWLNAGKKTDCPVCIMNAGYSSGWCEHSFGLPLVSVEILCRAKGDDRCRFIMASPERIEAHILRYVEQHPEQAKSVVNFQIPGFFAERLRTEAALNASKELNERLIEALPGGVVQVSKDGAILRANAEALRILGLSYDELTRKFVADFQTETIFEDGRPAQVADYPVTKAIMTGAPQPATTLGVRKPNAEISWAVFRAVPTRDPASLEINGAVVTFFDITERKRFEDKLRHTQKLESLGVLAGGIAHDFNNLLVTILGNASMAKRMAGGSGDLAPLLDEIEVGARRAAELTKQMLDYSGQGKFKVQSIELSAAIREMARLMKAVIPKQVELHYQFQEGLPPIDADPTQIRQVIMNLITNAAESIGDGTGRVVISVEQQYVSEWQLDEYTAHAATPGTFLCVEVSDTGCGMDEDTKSRIFDPFFTTKFKGRGLGMAAVLGIIRGHAGAIRIDSREGAGTRVRVLLPAKTSADAAETPASGRGAILVVDDDSGVQSVARRVLASKGHRIITASNGAEGVRLFEQHQGDIRLVLMDMTMPQMSGIDALRRIRTRSASVPVLLSSGYDVDRSGVDPREFSGFLEKPYSAEELLDAVDKALRSRPTSERVRRQG
jgi:signal transduction histidine kinase/CheY-like chemotaxis protein/predicted hydrocarbon binding protein